MKKLAFKAVYVPIIILFVTNLQAQKEGNFWHFGQSNALDFSSGVPLAVSGSQQSTFEGCASICDTAGNLLFYINGGGRDPILSGQSSGKIWNGQNQVIYDMGNTEGGGFSAAQSSVFVPKPADPGHYYLFTMDEVEFNVGGSVPGQPVGRGLSWFELDANANGGQGAVVDNEQMLFTPSYEGLCAVRSSNGQDYWIFITLAGPVGNLICYSVTADGIQQAGTYYSGYGTSMIKGSPDGAHLAVQSGVNGVTLFSFDNATGIPTLLFETPDAGRYFEFSPNGKYLYTVVSTAGGPIIFKRFDLTATDVAGSLQVIGSYANPNSFFQIEGQMQLAPDHQIYVVISLAGETTLSAITCPNEPTPFIDKDLFTYQQSGSGEGPGDFFGLPNFPNWIFFNESTAFSVDAGPDQVSLCGDESIYLTVVAPGATDYAWSNGETTATTIATSPGLYMVTVTNSCGSIGIDSVLVTEGATVSINLDQAPCSSTAQLTALSTLPGADFLWEDGSSEAVRTVSASGDYFVTVSGDNNCTGTAIISVDINPTLITQVGPDSTVLAGQPVPLFTTVDTTVYNGPYTVSWSPQAGLSCTDCLDPIATVELSTTFYQTFTLPDGCAYIDSLVITVADQKIEVPNAFSPNNDQINDIFRLTGGSDIKAVRRFEIYNRWGEKIFESRDFQISNTAGGWDGKNPDGQEAPAEVYIWIAEIELPSGSLEILKGDLTLIR